MQKVFDPDQAQCSVEPDLGPNCWKGSAANDKKSPQAGRVEIDKHKHVHNSVMKMLSAFCICCISSSDIRLNLMQEKKLNSVQNAPRELSSLCP